MEAKTGFEVLEETSKLMDERKVAKKALTETEKALANLLEKDVGFVKEADKLKSATYRQLLARKLKLEDLLSFYKMFDLM